MPILLLLFLLYWYIMFNDTGQSLLSSNLSTTMSITPKVRLCSKCAHTFHDRNFYLGWDFCVCFLLLFLWLLFTSPFSAYHTCTLQNFFQFQQILWNIIAASPIWLAFFLSKLLSDIRIWVFFVTFSFGTHGVCNDCPATGPHIA